MLFLTVWTCALFYLAHGEENYDLVRKAMENPDLFGGDMLVNMDINRAVIPEKEKRWSSAKVPFVIDGSLQEHADFILKAMEEYQSKTCVRFEHLRPEDTNYIRIFQGYGCYSQVGMVGGAQMVSLGKDCLNVGTAMHVLGHALGFFHEQNRSDRDDYVEIYFDNVQRGQEHNFYKLGPEQNLLLTPFDYDSIMMYGNDAFSKDGSVTMKAKNGQKLVSPDKKQSLSDSDVKRINKIYCGAQ